MAVTPTGNVPDPSGDVVTLAGTYTVAKSDDTQQNVFGWAYISDRRDDVVKVDHDGDIVPIAELEKAAYSFVVEARDSGEDHTETVDGEVIESVVFTDDKLEAMGLAKDALPQGWWIGVHIPDAAAYERAKTSKSAFSIEGTAYRAPVEVDA